MGHFPRFLSTFEAVRAEFGPTGRQEIGILFVFCLLSLEIQSGLREKRRFLRSARKRKDDSRILLSQMD